MLKVQRPYKVNLTIKTKQQFTQKSVLGKIRLHKSVSQFHKNSYFPPPHETANICILLWETNLARINSRLYPTVWSFNWCIYTTTHTHHAYCNMSSCCSHLPMLIDFISDPYFFTWAALPTNILLSYVNTTKFPANAYRSSPFCFLSPHLSLCLKSFSSVSCLLTSVCSQSSCSVSCTLCLISLYATPLFLSPISQPTFNVRGVIKSYGECCGCVQSKGKADIFNTGSGASNLSNSVWQVSTCSVQSVGCELRLTEGVF